MSVVDRVLEALNAGDIDAFVRCYGADATIENGYGRVAATGHEDVEVQLALHAFFQMMIPTLHR